MHNRLRPIKSGRLRFWNFGSHFLDDFIGGPNISDRNFNLTPHFFRVQILISLLHFMEKIRIFSKNHVSSFLMATVPMQILYPSAKIIIYNLFSAA